MLIANKRFFFDSEQPQIGKKAPAGVERPVGAKSIWVYAVCPSLHGHRQASPGSVAGFGLREDTFEIAEHGASEPP